MCRPPQIINETLPALQQLKQQGLVRFIGITGLPFKCLTYVLDRVPPGVCVCVLGREGGREGLQRSPRGGGGGPCRLEEAWLASGHPGRKWAEWC